MKNKKTVLLGIGVGTGIALFFLSTFLAGFYLGKKKAAVFPFWERRYTFPKGFGPGRFGHGLMGRIDSMGNNTFIVEDRSGTLKTVLIDDQTVLRRDGSPINFLDLKKDEQVIVLGDPQEKEGAIKAKVIRVIIGPPKPMR